MHHPAACDALHGGNFARAFRSHRRGFGLRFDEKNARLGAYECADRVVQFIRQFEVPSRLRDVEVPRTQLSRIAQTVLHEIVPFAYGRSRSHARRLESDSRSRILKSTANIPEA